LTSLLRGYRACQRGSARARARAAAVARGPGLGDPRAPDSCARAPRSARRPRRSGHPASVPRPSPLSSTLPQALSLKLSLSLSSSLSLKLSLSSSLSLSFSQLLYSLSLSLSKFTLFLFLAQPTPVRSGGGGGGHREAVQVVVADADDRRGPRHLDHLARGRSLHSLPVIGGHVTLSPRSSFSAKPHPRCAGAPGLRGARKRRWGTHLSHFVVLAKVLDSLCEEITAQMLRRVHACVGARGQRMHARARMLQKKAATGTSGASPTRGEASSRAVKTRGGRLAHPADTRACRCRSRAAGSNER
jgi:hypothetical protein